MCCRGLSEGRKLYLGLFGQYFSCLKGGGGGGGQYWLIRCTKTDYKQTVLNQMKGVWNMIANDASPVSLAKITQDL